MKDYTDNKKDADNFILYFESIKDELVIQYASGRIDRKPNTIENERMLLNRMRTQVLEMGLKLKRINILSYLFSILQPTIVISFILSLIDPEMALICVCNILTAMIIKNAMDKKKDIDEDISKNLSFLQNEQVINECLSDIELKHVSVRAQSIFSQPVEIKPYFTLNDVEQISFEDMNTILDELEKNYGDEYPIVRDGVNKRVRNRKK